MITLKLANEEKTKATFVITDGQIVWKDGAIIQKEMSLFEVSVKLGRLKNKKRKIKWQIRAIAIDAFNIEEDEQNELDKVLLGVTIKFRTNEDGGKIKLIDFKKSIKEIGKNIKAMISAADIGVGTTPGHEAEAEKILIKSYKWLYKDELKRYIKKAHRKYGESLPLIAETKTNGTFKRKLSKEPIPSIDTINTSLKEDERVYEYTLVKKMDVEKTLQLFSKSAADFHPFDKDQLQVMVETGKFDCAYEERVKYNKELGVIEKYEEKSISIMDGKKTEDILSFVFE